MAIGPDPADAPRAKDGFERWFLRVFMLLIFGGFTAELLIDYVPAHLSILYFLVSWVVLIVVHELAHALVARALGWEVSRFVIGVGGKWREFRVAGVAVELRALPLGGYVVPIPPNAHFGRLKSALIYAAGPGAELLLAGLLILLVGPERMFSEASSAGILAAQSFCVAATWGAVTNLLPFRTAKGSVSDGLGILISPWLTPEDFAIRRLAPEIERLAERLKAQEYAHALEMSDALVDAHPGVLTLHFIAAEALVALGRRGEALMRVQSLLRQHPGDRRLIEAQLDHLRSR